MKNVNIKYLAGRLRIIGVVTIFISFFFAEGAFAPPPASDVSNTKHNLSVSGPGTVKATAETEICVFCHLPHNANPAVPLWSHNVSSAAYTMYNSEYLNRANYAVPAALGQYPNTGYRSRLCLSCHDGTVAIGQVYVLRGQKLSSPINMQGVTADNKMLPASAAYLGTDLTNDHPVAIVYDTAKTITFGSGSRNMELNATVPPVNPKPYEGIKLFSPSPGYVECPSCHDPHVTSQKFLTIWNTNLATTIGDICNTCHDKINWSTGIHKTSGSSYTEAAVQTNYGLNTISGLVCANCHRPHGGPGSPYWYNLRQQEETTCFRGAASASTGAPCHGTGAAAGGQNIETSINRQYKHPTTTITGVHTNLDVLATQTGPKSFNWGSSKHAECVDCHNPHQAQQGNHTPANQWYPTTVDANTNFVSNALRGVTGVEPTTEPDWTPPTSYTTYNAATKEYQICFKCHSYYALQDGDGVSIYTTSFGDSAIITDQAMEYSRGNKSAHPVRAGLSSQTGSYAPQALASAQMGSPWDTNVGTQTMYCSDCHGTDNEASGEPKGPHASSYRYMLKGTRKYWPTKSDGSTLWTLNDMGGADAGNNLFCVNCHPNDRSMNNVHSANSHWDGTLVPAIPCVKCHVAVPHGSKRSRLVGYSSDNAPYNYSNNLEITQFKKAAGPTSYTISPNYCQAPCHASHSGAVSGADP